MKTIWLNKHPRNRIKSFYYAGRGILHAFKHEANFRIQTVIIIVTTALGFWQHITQTEWLFLILAGVMLLAGEIMNTIVEEFIDHLIKDHHEGARIIKDLSAGFVLIFALGYLVIALLIFLA